MTTETEQTNDAELAKLRAHNVDLLAELKAARTDRTRLAAELEARTGERDAAAAEVDHFRLNLPVAEMLEDVAVPGMEAVWLSEFKRAGYEFVLDNGVPVVRDAEGKPAMVQGPKDEEPRPVRFDYHDLVLLTCGPGSVPIEKQTPSQRAFAALTLGSKASGAGGHSSYDGGFAGPRKATPDPTPAPAPAHSFGLR